MLEFRWLMSEFGCGQDLVTGSVRDAAVGATTVEPGVGPLARLAPLSQASPAAAASPRNHAARCLWYRANGAAVGRIRQLTRSVSGTLLRCGGPLADRPGGFGG